MARKTLVNHLQGRLTPAYDAILGIKVVAGSYARICPRLILRSYIPTIHSVEQRIDFILGKYVVGGHQAYCMTKLVK